MRRTNVSLLWDRERPNQLDVAMAIERGLSAQNEFPKTVRIEEVAEQMTRLRFEDSKGARRMVPKGTDERTYDEYSAFLDTTENHTHLNAGCGAYMDDEEHAYEVLVPVSEEFYAMLNGHLLAEVLGTMTIGDAQMSLPRKGSPTAGLVAFTKKSRRPENDYALLAMWLIRQEATSNGQLQALKRIETRSPSIKIGRWRRELLAHQREEDDEQ